MYKLLATGLLAMGCGDRARPAPAHVEPGPQVVASIDASVAQAPVDAEPVAIDAPAPVAASNATVVPLPEEPWYRTKSDRRDVCVASLPVAPQQHFPVPFDRCDPTSTSYASPPGSQELHFHYRYFSAALTVDRRRKTPGACCYIIWEFPRTGP